jgi:hypothetical protein
MRKSISSDISFADSEIISYIRAENTLKLQIKAWNESTVTINFFNVAGVADYSAGDFSDFAEEVSNTVFMERVLKELYESIPEHHPYHLFQFLNLDDTVSFEVLAETFVVSII